MSQTRDPMGPAAAIQAQASPLERYLAVRRATLALTRSLTAEDQGAQSMPDASPTKWHLAHTTWFFETFLLAPRLARYKVFDPRFAYFFNSYYEALGPRQPRPERGLLTRPSLDDVLSYRGYVDDGMTQLLESGAGDLAVLLDLGLAHEEQHQELILMDILHLFAQSPLSPAYAPPRPAAAQAVRPLRFIRLEGGLTEIGTDGPAFAFDNEGPRHKVWLEPFELADRLVTNGEWLAFMEDGGYRRPELWLSAGWDRVQAEGWSAPFYWREAEEGWRVMSLNGLRPLDPAAPVSHLSFYEAQAYAEWAGARLPGEAEWEHAAADLSADGVFLGSGRLQAQPPAPGRGLRQMFGDLWEWTRSPYAPYPGFRPAAGAVGEYNGKFMDGQYVLRGGACVTPAGHVRPTYRNFFAPHQRWMFSGLRLARDAGLAEEGVEDSAFAQDVLAGLAAQRKAIPPKYFYDAEGSRLFEQICDLPEYYPTRTETALLRKHAAEMVAGLPPGAALVEFGSGASTKTRLLLDARPDLGVYVPIDISPTALDEAVRSLAAGYPDLSVQPLAEDFTRALALPAEAQARPVMGFFPGSTIGNFTAPEARAFLENARHLLGPGASFLVGFDLVKPIETMTAAYDDAAGVTAAFNLNLLARINRELEGTFDLPAFRHRAIWNPAESRIEMHLESLADQTAEVLGWSFRFRQGETLHTENACKYSLEGISALAEATGWSVAKTWVSEDHPFAIARLDQT